MGQLKAVSPVYPAFFLLAYEALVKVLFGRELSSASAAGQEMSLVSEIKVVPSRQLAGWIGLTPAVPLDGFPPLFTEVITCQ